MRLSSSGLLALAASVAALPNHPARLSPSPATSIVARDIISLTPTVNAEKPEQPESSFPPNADLAATELPLVYPRVVADIGAEADSEDHGQVFDSDSTARIRDGANATVLRTVIIHNETFTSQTTKETMTHEHGWIRNATWTNSTQTEAGTPQQGSSRSDGTMIQSYDKDQNIATERATFWTSSQPADGPAVQNFTPTKARQRLLKDG